MPLQFFKPALVVSLALMSAAALAAEMPSERYARYAFNNARLLGLTPKGTALWAEHILRSGDWREWRRVTEIEAEFGRQLALAEADQPLLEQLANEYGAESARAARARKQRTVYTALKLQAEDRRAIGAFIEKRSKRSMEPPDLQPGLSETVSDLVSGFYTSFGLSAKSTKLLIQAGGDQYTGTPARVKLEGAIGVQLSRDRPDLQALNDLISRFATEEARLAQLEKKRLIQIAKRLTPVDRRRLGHFMADAAAEALRNETPAFEIVP